MAEGRSEYEENEWQIAEREMEYYELANIECEYSRKLFQQAEDRIYVEQILNKLPGMDIRKRDIFFRCFAGETFDSVGQVWNISRARVSCIYSKVIYNVALCIRMQERVQIGW